MNPHNGMSHATSRDHHTAGVGSRSLTAESSIRSLQRALMHPRRFVRHAGQALGTLTLALVLAACGIGGPSPVSPAAQSGATQVSTVPLSFNGQTSDEIVATALAANKKSHAQANDVEYDAATVVRIALTGAGATVNGGGVQVDGSIVTISAPGTYLISGTLADGRVVVNSADDGKVRLVLDGASITSSNGPAIHIAAADEAVVVLAEGSSNVLKDGNYAAADSDAPNAALYSMADLTIGGTGSLSVEGTSFDGIASKDGLVILGGRITVSAADDGIRG